MPAALLVVLAALAWLLGAPAAAPAGSTATRAVVGDPAPAPQRLSLRPHRPAKWTGQVLRRAVPSRSAPGVAGGIPTAWHRLADRVAAPASPTSPPALPWVPVLLALLLLGRAHADRSWWSLSGRTPGSHRGRSPPAYALV